MLSIVRVNGRDIPVGLYLEDNTLADTSGRTEDTRLVDASGRTIDEATLGIVPGGSGVESIQLPGDDEPISQEQLSAELLLIGTVTEAQGEPVLTEVNGFVMNVQTDEETPVGSLKRALCGG